jgi:hypothetical protein
MKHFIFDCEIYIGNLPGGAANPENGSVQMEIFHSAESFRAALNELKQAENVGTVYAVRADVARGGAWHQLGKAGKWCKC